eukprot:scaffold1151_cov144-Skeletonema_menzelii.AAC.5
MGPESTAWLCGEYTAAVAALHLFILSSHQQSKPRDATIANASATKIIPSFDGNGNTPSPPTLRAIFRSTYRSQSHVSLYRPIMLCP